MASSQQSKLPVKPIKIETDQVYLHISHSSPSSRPELTGINHANYQIKYLGPIGELKGEGIYQIQNVQGVPIKRHEGTWQNDQSSILDRVKKSPGVSSVKVMEEPKQRSKRDEF